jgi:spore maturation protein CgeB
MLRFLIESSPTPIYQRITSGYRQALEQHHHQVVYLEPGQFSSFDAALDYLIAEIQSNTHDCFLVFDNSPLSTFYLKEEERFVFEQFDRLIIFIHHDNVWNSLVNSKLLAAWQQVKNHSIHFCLEYENFLDLRAMGFEQVYLIAHGSEFKKIDRQSDYTHQVSFVGHVLPNFQLVFDRCQSFPYSHLAAADFWSRLVSLEQKIDPSATRYAHQSCEQIYDAEFIARKSAYYYTINLLSTCFRGELLKRLDPAFQLSIIGGDPGYLTGVTADRQIRSESITYYPPVSDYRETQNLYAHSKINLNITSLQFDQAVVNRTIDVAYAGGFILTDWKPDLKKLTQVSKQISYRTIQELNDKIAYYLKHEDERLEIANQLHQDVVKQCSYTQIIEFLLTKINLMVDRQPLSQLGSQLDSQSEPVLVDLGCGTHKPHGFIGVDVSFQAGVDIVADLNQRFPFPDNSVDFLRAHDLVEHLVDRIHTMNEIWRICKPDAQIDIRVPSTDGRGAFQDPTHISFWNINSFKYYCAEFPEYLDLCQSYGFKGEFNIIGLGNEETTPDQVIHVRAILKAKKSFNVLLELEDLRLREINLMIFPDWSQPDHVLYPSLTNVIRSIALHPDRHRITLLVDQTNFPNDAEIGIEPVLYDLMFNLLMTEDLEIADGELEISLVDNLNPDQTAALLPKISGRISLPQENLATIAAFGATNIPICDLNQGNF